MTHRIKICLAPALLVAVALSQLATVEITGLSRWEGGGFGMYSELPPMTRHVLIDVSKSPNQLPGRAVGDLTGKTERFQLIPTNSNLEAVGKVLHQHSVVPFRVEAWAERFDLSTGEVSLKRIGRISATSASE
ncbi:MAG: hypothetical protein CMP28_14635 [Roseibacillus sp.]|nr:hypothetical protein [Roseibacillus sp.]